MRLRVLLSLCTLALCSILAARTAPAAPLLAEHAASRAAAVSGSAPVLDPLNDMTVSPGDTATQPLHATDADGDSLSFYKASGAAFVTVVTTDPGAGTGDATGLLTAMPAASDAGTSIVYVGVTDGHASSLQSVRIVVPGSNRAPLLTPPTAMSVRAGQVANQTLYATDPDGDPLSFAKASGPSYMDVTTTIPGAGSAQGNVRLAPSSSNVGNAIGTVSVSDGALSDQKSFGITVTSAGNPPFLYYLNNMTVRAGSTADQSLYASDSDGDPVTFSKSAGPSYMTVSTTSPGAGSAYGNLHLAPGANEFGTTGGTVRASDGALFDEKSLSITVTPPDRPPVLTVPATMTVQAGEVKETMVTATDPDGDYIYLSGSFSFSWAYLSYGSGYGSASAILHVAPGSANIGVFPFVVTANSNGLYDQETVQITVTQGNFPAACPSGSFGRITSVFGSGVIEVQSADLNGDGLPDVIVEMPNSGRVVAAMGIGDGSFGPPLELEGGSNPVSGVIADYNRDGFVDAAILDNGQNRVWVFPGDGAGGFGQRQGFAVPNARSIAAADMNRDGKIDLLLACSNSSTVAVLRGNGDGTFGGAVSYAAGGGAWHLTTADLNGDGAPDIAVTNPYDDDISVLLNSGAGSFLSRTDYPTGNEPLAVSAGDLNGDGKLDLVVSNAGSASVSVLLGNGNGTMGIARSFSTGYGPRQIAIADLNGDGRMDIATPCIDSNVTSILLGDGAGALGSRLDVPVGSAPYGIALADYNDDLRPDVAVAEYYGGSVSVLLNGCAPPRDHPPVVHAPVKVSGNEGSPVSFAVTATDPDGPEIATFTASFAGLPLGHNATFVSDPAGGSGQFSWTPGYQDARTTPYEVTFTATNVLSGSAKTRITVSNVNRAPVANAGGPYSALAGYPVTLDGSGSLDPDGDALTYAWILGDGMSAMGAKPVHTYIQPAVYGIALTVSDGSLAGVAATTVTVVGVFETRVFTSSGSRTIKLSAGKPQWCANLEPVGAAYTNAEVDLRTIVLRSPGTGSISEIHALADKTSIGSDRDGNGAEEIEACFAKSDLRLLFSNLKGTTTVPVTIEGRLYSGGIFRGHIDIGVNASGGQLAAAMTPNPLNPDAVLTFRTRTAGFARVAIFDAGGRLVRRMLDEPSLAPGYHDLRFDGFGGEGRPLPSGIYFFRIEAQDGIQTGRFTILK